MCQSFTTVTGSGAAWVSITMKRVVVVGIPLNVISTYALLETGWKTVLGNAEESGLFFEEIETSFEDF